MLGWMHETGRGVPKDLGEAERWFRLSAAQGNAVAREHLKYLEAVSRTSGKVPETGPAAR
jgi:TPR repeat protein